jgi:hypothetical protein
MTVSRGIRKPYRPSVWSDEAKSRLAAMWHAGASDSTIANALRLTVRSVAVQRSKQGLIKHRTRKGERYRQTNVGRMRTHVMVAELRRRGFTVLGTEGDEAPAIDPRELGPALSGGMLL